MPWTARTSSPTASGPSHVTRDLNDPSLDLGARRSADVLRNRRRPGGQRDRGRERRLAANLPRHAGTADHQRADHRLAGLQPVRTESRDDHGYCGGSGSASHDRSPATPPSPRPPGNRFRRWTAIYDGRFITFTSGVDAGQKRDDDRLRRRHRTPSRSRPPCPACPTRAIVSRSAATAAQGPTPLVNSLTISVQDLPARVAGFLYNVLAADATLGYPATDPGNYLLVGDANGVIQITSVAVQSGRPRVAGSPATGTLRAHFRQPAARRSLHADDQGQRGRSGGQQARRREQRSEPNGAPTFPSGDGQPGGNFVARFTVDSRPEIGTWSAGSVYVDTNGNFTFDPTNADATNRDMIYNYGLHQRQRVRRQLQPDRGGNRRRVRQAGGLRPGTARNIAGRSTPTTTACRTSS